MSIIAIDAKIVIKEITTTGTTFTMGPSTDHTDGSWNATDIYPSEFGFNSGDGKLFIGTNAGVQELTLVPTGETTGVPLQFVSGTTNSVKPSFGTHTFDTASTNSVILGGDNNIMTGSTNSTIGGGKGNTMTTSVYSFIGGGKNSSNIANFFSTIGGGHNNDIYSSNYSTIGGGKYNTHTEGSSNTIGGGYGNVITGCSWSNIGAGFYNKILGVFADVSTIGGGDNNNITNSSECIIGGGQSNNIEGGDFNSILGGRSNEITSTGDYNSIGGGYTNTIDAAAIAGTIAGGWGNDVGSSFSSIAGGQNNDTSTFANVHILGSSITATVANTTYVEALDVKTGGIMNDDNGTILRKKVIDIGDWDMDATTSLNVAHGLSATEWKTIRTITGIIRNDANTSYFPVTNAGDDLDVIIANFNSTNIAMSRKLTGTYDSTLFNATSYNRGWITIEYTPA